MNKLLLKFTLICLLFSAIGYAAGALSVTYDQLPECGLITTQPGEICYQVQQKFDCDTDSDCLDKYGCGSYSDPCDDVQSSLQLDQSREVSSQ